MVFLFPFGDEVPGRRSEIFKLPKLSQEISIVAKRLKELAQRLVVGVRVGEEPEDLGVLAGRGTFLASFCERQDPFVIPTNTFGTSVVKPLQNS